MEVGEAVCKEDSWMQALVIIAAALWMTVDCNAHAGEILSKCRQLAEPIHLAATEHRVPVLLLISLGFAESTCNKNAVNESTGATGVFQLMTLGAGVGYSQEELKNPWLNSWLASAHLSRWFHRCGTWRGAVEVFGARKTCKVRSAQGAKIIMTWKRLEREAEPRT